MSSLDITTVRTAVQAITQTYNKRPADLMQMLWRVQEQYSYIPNIAIETLAGELNLTYAHVAGVAGFYSFFHNSPRGQYDILFSDNIIEHWQGKPELMNYLLKKLGVELNRPRADGRVTVGNTSCIGMSDQGPAILVNGHALTRLSLSRIDEMANLIEQQIPLTDWPREWFTIATNIQQTGLLLGHPFVSGESLKTALAQGPDVSLTQIGQAGLRGCGGAGFKTEVKWKLCRNTPSDQRFVICNADEGEPGTFKDRVLLQKYADIVFEGMTLCAYIIGAKRGFLYLRGEYRFLLPELQATLAKRRQANLLGPNILGNPNLEFDIEIHLGAGAYICGAETALIESLEGKRGTACRKAPPYPVTQGYLNQPTVVNNVETFALAARIITYGADRFAELGTTQSKGTKLLSISGDCDKPGIYEFPFGVTVREVLAACGAREVQAVQNAGPAGICVSPAEFDRKLCFEDLNTTGSFMIFNQQRDLLEMARNFAQFFVHETCGFCTPCRVGTGLVQGLIEKIAQGNGSPAELEELTELSHLIKTTSHCGLGLTATNFVQDTLKKFPFIYQKHFKLNTSGLTPTFNLEASLEAARRLTQRNDSEAHLG